MRVRRNVCCIHCGKPFVPNPRLGERQKTCGSKKCKRLQNLLAQKYWKKENRELCRQNQKDWQSNHSDYWRNWRLNHPDYVARNRARSKIRRFIFQTRCLQKKLDILQLTEKHTEFWTFHGFAKQTRSLSTLSVAYMLNHENRSQGQQKSQSP